MNIQDKRVVYLTKVELEEALRSYLSKRDIDVTQYPEGFTASNEPPGGNDGWCFVFLAPLDTGE